MTKEGRLVFLKTEILLPEILTVTTSGFPSLSKSAVAWLQGWAAVVTDTAPAKDEVVKDPGPATVLNMLNELAPVTAE